MLFCLNKTLTLSFYLASFRIENLLLENNNISEVDEYNFILTHAAVGFRYETQLKLYHTGGSSLEIVPQLAAKIF